MSCSICLENYNNQTCIPMTLAPCGHGVCETCLNMWNRSTSSTGHACPECRQNIETSIRNRTLLDIIEQSSHPELGNDGLEASGLLSSNTANQDPNQDPNGLSNSTIFSNLNGNSWLDKPLQRRPNEILHDKCGYCFLVIDNSGSMCNEDGKQFYEDKGGKIIKYQYTSRWDEAVSKTIQIADYNIKRGIITSYYLLNPSNRGNWREDMDFLVINPSDNGYKDKFWILKNTILSETNIRGNTPLDQITIKFGEFLRESQFENQTVSYNLVTDGEPNNKPAFESELRRLAKEHSVFIVVNLCTDLESVIDYYNDLDVKIGNELSGLDVIDDFEAEQLEVNAKNDFFVYSFKIHVARMAGCYSVVADMMDEEVLPLPYLHKLVKELLLLKDKSLNISDQDRYLSIIDSENSKANNVYNYLTSQFELPINIEKLIKHMKHPHSHPNKNNNRCTIS